MLLYRSTVRAMGIERPVDIHAAVETAFNAGDVDALVDLYEKGARMAAPGGTTVEGHDAIREQWAAILAMGGEMRLATDFVIEAGDIALLRNTWTWSNGDAEMSAHTAEVVRRQPDGSWLYAIDHPFGASETLP